MKSLLRLLTIVCCLMLARAEEILPGAKRLLILGDSITYAGGYVDELEAFVRTQFPGRSLDIVACGLPSETVSGLSEAGHAGGKFPRPDVHERLVRVLDLVQPDVVFACYGMNCGIYLPLEETRFAKYRDGITRLRAAVEQRGAKMIHLTPAVFDAVPLAGRVFPAETVQDGQQFSGYDEVLARYAGWLVEQRGKGWQVIDTHTAMRAALDAGRAKNPGFKFAGDGVHPNEEGQRVMAEAVIRELAPQAAEKYRTLTASALWQGADAAEVRKLIQQRRKVISDSYLTVAGHKRPGMKVGLSLKPAREKAQELDAEIAKKIQALLSR